MNNEQWIRLMQVSAVAPTLHDLRREMESLIIDLREDGYNEPDHNPKGRWRTLQNIAYRIMDMKRTAQHGRTY